VSQDTIVAIATAAGRGAVGIVRVSGPATRTIMQAVCGTALAARYATHLAFLDEQGNPIDDGLAIFFPGPNSYTGEDVLELQGHGGVGVLSAILNRCLSLQHNAAGRQAGRIRLAEPGEFTRRAFLNDKLDLAQAEAVADLINAGSERAAQSALASLRGAFSRAVEGLQQRLTDLRVRVEACLDFPEEDLEFIAREGVAQRLLEIQAGLKETLLAAQQGAALRDGLRVVLVGAPNVGKSSLLNALSGQEVALVTEVAGTTRDRIVQEIVLQGLAIHVVDTAGLRHTQDTVEQLGIARTWQEVGQAQAVLLMRDASGEIAIDRELERQVLERVPAMCQVIEVNSKADLLPAKRSRPPLGLDTSIGVRGSVMISSKTGQGLDQLRAMLIGIAGLDGQPAVGVFSARARHLQALLRAQTDLLAAESHLHQQELELLAECLGQAQGHLAEITGEFSADDLLGEIFGSFCIGK
jgi:tRNA modification GTPase